jgi:guanine deaminase
MDYLRHALDLAAHSKGGPFGACLVNKDGVIVEGQNEVIASHDPTAHAEIVAIRAACKAIGSHDLSGWTLYSSCEPCPMCLGAIEWSRIHAVYYAATRYDAEAIGFDDASFYDERTVPLIQDNDLAEEAGKIMRQWAGTRY